MPAKAILPWRPSRFFRYMAEGSKKDCCNEYTCIQKGFGADISSGGLALRPMKTKNKCPDYSAVSSLETLMKHGISDGHITMVRYFMRKG